MKKLLLLACVCVAFGLGACTSDEEFDTTVELSCPKPYVDQAVRRDITIKWPAIAKTAGYACRVDHNGTQGEWEFFDSDVLSWVGTKLSNGRYQFHIYAVGDDDHTVDSQTRMIEFDIDYDPVLAKPAPRAVPLNSEASISWSAVANAAGYAYKLDDAAEWTRVGADVLLVKTEALENGLHTFTMYAVGSEENDTIDSEPASITFTIDYTPGPDYSTGVYLRVLPQGVTQPGADITQITGEVYKFEATADANVYTKQLPAMKGLYTILVDGREYGWMPFSGNGCVGRVNNENSAIPFMSDPGYYSDYTVRESVGRLTADGSGLALYANLAQQRMITFTVDCSYGDDIPRYALSLEPEDPSVIFEHYFDLMAWGGDWVAGNTIKGNRVPIDNNTPKLNNVDGTEAATNHSASYTNGGAAEDWTIKSARYDQNRDLKGWEGNKVIEHPGYVRVNTGGYIMTPKFSALTGAADIIVEIDICRFSNVGPNTFTVEGGGLIKSCHYRKDGAATETPAEVSGTESTFVITEEMASPYNSGAAKTGAKQWTHLRFEIEGATPESRIGLVGVVSTSRICIDNVVVKRK